MPISSGKPSKYRSADKFLAQPGRKQANVSLRMAWISFGSLPCKGQLASWCCWNRARSWHASKLVSFLVGLRTYQHPGSQISNQRLLWGEMQTDRSLSIYLQTFFLTPQPPSVGRHCTPNSHSPFTSTAWLVYCPMAPFHLWCYTCFEFLRIANVFKTLIWHYCELVCT